MGFKNAAQRKAVMAKLNAKNARVKRRKKEKKIGKTAGKEAKRDYSPYLTSLKGKQHRGGTKKQTKTALQRLRRHGGIARGGHTAPKLAGKVPKKGERKGQSIKFGDSGYLKGGRYHEYDMNRDRRIKAKTIRKPGAARWRGDLQGGRI